MSVSFGPSTISEFFSAEEREFIISKFPESLRHYLVGVRNPLDIQEILVSMVSSWDVRIVYVPSSEDHLVYFSGSDVARATGYDESSVGKWRPWLVENGFNFTRGVDIRGSENSSDPLVFVGSSTGGFQPEALYLDAEALRVVLVKMNKPRAKEFGLMLNSMVTVLRKVMLIMHSHSAQKNAQEIAELRLRIKAQEEARMEQIFKVSLASDIWRVPVDAPGEVYVGHFLDQKKSLMFKVGIATETGSRQVNYNTSDNIVIDYRVMCKHAKRAESIIRELLTPLRVYNNREFYWGVGDSYLRSTVDAVVGLVDKYQADNTDGIKNLRREFIEKNHQVPLDEATIKTEPSLRSRSRSPSKKSMVEAELAAAVAAKDGKLTRGDKAAARRRVEAKLLETLQ